MLQVIPHSDFDAIVPVPLSPDRDVHRALELAVRISRGLGVPLLEPIGLTKPCRRHTFRSAGLVSAPFAKAYAAALKVTGPVPARVLLVDDICTDGTTLAVIAAQLGEVNPAATFSAATFGLTVRRGIYEPPRAEAPPPPPDEKKPAPVVTADGHEIEILDSLLPTLQPRARAGDQVAIDQLVKVLDLRLKYKRQSRAEED